MRSTHYKLFQLPNDDNQPIRCLSKLTENGNPFIEYAMPRLPDDLATRIKTKQSIKHSSSYDPPRSCGPKPHGQRNEHACEVPRNK